MKLSSLALAAALSAVWAALPLAVFAQNDGKGGGEETIEIRKRVRHDDGDRDDRGDRDEHGDREDHGDRRGPRDGGDRREQDPEVREKLDKMRELENKAHDLSLNLRNGTDEEKAAAKKELRKTIGELFDAKLSLETAMLAKMEKHVAELKARIAKKKSAREKAIESRYMRMAGDGDEWD